MDVAQEENELRELSVVDRVYVLGLTVDEILLDDVNVLSMLLCLVMLHHAVVIKVLITNITMILNRIYLFLVLGIVKMELHEVVIVEPVEGLDSQDFLLKAYILHDVLTLTADYLDSLRALGMLLKIN